MNCAACGAPNLSEATTCARCGAALRYGAGGQAVTAPLETVSPTPRPGAAGSSPLLFVPAALAALDAGAVLKTIASFALQAAAVLTGLWGVVVWVKTWEGTKYLEGAEVLGLVLFQLVVLVMIYALVHALWIRARAVARLPTADWVAIPVAAACVRALGEVYAIAGAFTGAALALLVLVAGERGPGGLLLAATKGLFPATPGPLENQVAAAVTALASYGLASVAGLLAAYLAAELLLAVAEIARREGGARGSRR